MGHPYSNLPPERHWPRGVARVSMVDVDPVGKVPFLISPTDKVATAGSCFAQHIARHLARHGFNYYVAEPAHPIVPSHLASEYGYGLFSARYGNVYTARQLKQLFQRAFGLFKPTDCAWRENDGSWRDPFRPSINPLGFASLRELEVDVQQHLSCVREMFEQLDVFVFTLGLTECWVSAADGAAYPVCPGTVAGTFNPTQHLFHNFTVDEVLQDITDFIDLLRRLSRCRRPPWSGMF
jgi:hypothetical protein